MHPLILAVSFLAVAAAVCIAAGLVLARRRRWCPQCHSKRLRRINYFRCNPPPNHSFFACEGCGGQFVQVDRYDGTANPLIPRAGSDWEHSPGWESPVRSSGRPQGSD